jgi:hypothetical protein
MAHFMQLLNPRAVRSSGKVRITAPSTKVLAEGGEALDAGKLVGLAIDIRIDFLSFECILPLPRSTHKARTIGQVEVHFTIPAIIRHGGVLQSHPSLAEEELAEVTEFRFADIILQPNEINPGSWNSREPRCPEGSPIAFANLKGPQVSQETSAATGTRSDPSLDDNSCICSNTDTIRVFNSC